MHAGALWFDHPSWDGRFFYFMVGGGGSGGVAVRCDTSRDFESRASWFAYDFAPILPARIQTMDWGGGVVFDGEYVYAASSSAPIVVRFDARTPPQMPKGFRGTFY